MTNLANMTPEQNLNVYSQNTSLLFQFILSEFLNSFEKVLEIEEVYDQMESTLIKHRLKGGAESFLSTLLHSIPALTGSQMVIVSEQSFSWAADKGSLNKLRHYCYLFTNRDRSEDKDIINMNVCVSKAFHSALQARELVLALQRESTDLSRVPNYVALYQLLDRLIDNLKRVSRLILRVLIQYREDENVLYFLLRNREKFDKLYRTKFVVKILKKMYPDGIHEAGNLLLEKYTRRGFDNLLSTISNHMSVLESCETGL